jgi:hypothetical protein
VWVASILPCRTYFHFQRRVLSITFARSFLASWSRLLKAGVIMIVIARVLGVIRRPMS